MEDKESIELLKFLTFRLGGHSSSDDPTKYRDESIAKQWEKRDPLDRHRAWLVGKGMWNDKMQEDFLAEAGTAISEAIARVEAAAPVETVTLFTDVWAEVPTMLRDQQDRYTNEETV